eukprot:8351499-Alexandrium_andersonii.AAC.1
MSYRSAGLGLGRGQAAAFAARCRSGQKRGLCFRVTAIFGGSRRRRGRCSRFRKMEGGTATWLC